MGLQSLVLDIATVEVERNIGFVGAGLSFASSNKLLNFFLFFWGGASAQFFNSLLFIEFTLIVQEANVFEEAGSEFLEILQRLYSQTDVLLLTVFRILQT